MRAFFLTLILTVNAWAAGPTCEGAFTADYRAFNPTASLSASDYTAPNARPYRDYVAVLRPSVSRGNVVVDLGGGQGRAMSELASRTGAETIVVNTQDFTGRYPNVRYLTGWAEEVLPRLPANSVDVVVDFFGAFHYSARKDVLVEEIFRALKPGGSASILFDFENSQAMVGRMRFDRYLERLAPDIFSVRLVTLNGREVSVLKIAKPRLRTWFGLSRATPSLELNLEVVNVDRNPRLRLAVPRVWFANPQMNPH